MVQGLTLQYQAENEKSEERLGKRARDRGIALRNSRFVSFWLHRWINTQSKLQVIFPIFLETMNDQNRLTQWTTRKLTCPNCPFILIFNWFAFPFSCNDEHERILNQWNFQIWIQQLTLKNWLAWAVNELPGGKTALDSLLAYGSHLFLFNQFFYLCHSTLISFRNFESPDHHETFFQWYRYSILEHKEF